MASETLSFDLYWNDRGASSGMLRTGAGMKELGAQAASSARDVKNLTDKVDGLKGRSAKARVGLEGDKEAGAELDKLDVKLIRLGNKAANPNITVEGKIKALADIAAVNLAMDRLNDKTARPSILGRISAGLLSGAGGPGAAAGILGLGAAIGPVLAGLTQAAAALAAAGAGVAAFGALAAPQFLAVKDVLSQVNLDTAAYERATTKAAKSTALKHIRQDWADISPAQRAAAHGILGLQTEFGKLSAKLAPLTFKVFNEGLKIAGKLLPDLLPFARAAGNAIDGLLTSLNKSVSGAGFKAFLAQLQALSGPAITALGQGMGKIAVAVGKLILVSAQPNSIKVLSGLLTVLAGTIDVVTFVIGRASGKIVEWKSDFHDIADVVSGWSENVIHVFDVFGHVVAGAFDTARHAAATFGHDIAHAFDTARHAVAVAGHDIAHAFDDVRHVFAIIGHAIADTFDRVRRFQGQFDAFGKDIALVRHWITVAFDAIRHSGAVAFDFLRHLIAAAWDRIWHDTASRLADLRHSIASTFDNIRHGIATAWDTIWRNMTSQARTGTGNLVSWFRGLPGRVLDALRGLGHSLYAFAHAALDEFWNGLKAVAGSVLSWVGNFVSNIWGKVKKFFGISSPSSLFYSAGKNLMLGLFHGIKDNAHHAVAAAQVVSRRVADAGAGVQRWAPLVLQALRMEGLSPRLLGNVLYQMQTESGGNPNAINLSDINAQMGDPSRGLMQTIMATFRAYHWPGTSGNIYDPLANIAAALNYARHRYGPSLMSGGMGIGSGHGYAAGSWNVPFTGPAVIHKGEMVIPAVPAAAIRRGGGTQTVVLEFRGGGEGRLTAALLEVLRREIRIRGGNTQQVLGRN